MGNKPLEVGDTVRIADVRMTHAIDVQYRGTVGTMVCLCLDGMQLALPLEEFQRRKDAAEKMKTGGEP